MNSTDCIIEEITAIQEYDLFEKLETLSHSENILIHNNNIKLSDFGTFKRSIKSPTLIHNLLENIQYVDPQCIQNIKTYTFKCWKHDADQRSTIQHIYQKLNEIDLNNGNNICQQSIKKIPLSKNKSLNDPNFLQKTIGQSTSTTNITSSLFKSGTIMNSNNFLSNPLSKELSTNDNFVQIFIKELFQFFIIQFNHHEFQKDIIHNLYKFIAKTGKNLDNVFNLLNKYLYQSWFTSIIGFFYEHGIGIPADDQKAFDLYKQASDDQSYIHLDDNNNNNINYFPSLDKLIKDNQIIGLISLGKIHLYNVFKIDHRRALHTFLDSVTKGSALGQYYVGNCYYYGYGTSVNLFQAFNWYLKSAEGGNSIGQYRVAYCYEFGYGIEIDLTKAFEWYLKAAENGDKNSQYEVGSVINMVKVFYKINKKLINGCKK
ncbi:kinase-like protein [Gigaspora margarita]|uniref:Kinase-like protein n=1 Tax=Gigaspora margarita TaxID=4874 RepID=A0A8H3WUT0_GIGMA|nr:kinase-like protein [Gigaspora margarita]